MFYQILGFTGALGGSQTWRELRCHYRNRDSEFQSVCNGNRSCFSSNTAISVIGGYWRLLEARAGAAECHRDVTGMTSISLKYCYSCYIVVTSTDHELELELEARVDCANALGLGA